MTPTDKKALLEALDTLNLVIVSRGITLRPGDREKYDNAVRIAKSIPESFGYAPAPPEWFPRFPTNYTDKVACQGAGLGASGHQQ